MKRTEHLITQIRYLAFLSYSRLEVGRQSEMTRPLLSIEMIQRFSILLSYSFHMVRASGRPKGTF